MDNLRESQYKSNINNIEGTEWNELVKGHYSNSLGSLEGRSLIYLNNQGDIRIFNSKADAKNAGFKKASYSKIVDISSKILNRTPDADQKYELSKVLNQVLIRKQIKMEAHPPSKISKLFRTIKPDHKEIAKNNVQEMAAKVQLKEMATPSQLRQLNVMLADIKYIRRSGAGTDGVLFLQNSDGNRLVVKPLRNPDPVCFSERLLEKMGFKTADTFFQPQQSENGVNLQDHLTKFQETLNDKNANENLRLQLKSCQSYQIAKAVDGQNLKEMSPDRLKDILSNPSIQKELGKIILIDSFMGNDDRLQPWSPGGNKFNMGNVMVAGPSTEPRLVLIDNEAKLSRDLAIRSETALGYLLFGQHNGRVEKYAQQIIKSVNEQSKDDLGLNQNVLTQNLSVGVLEAAKDLLQRFGDSSGFAVLLRAEGIDSASIDIDVIGKNLETIKKYIDSNK